MDAVSLTIQMLRPLLEFIADRQDKTYVLLTYQCEDIKMENSVVTSIFFISHNIFNGPFSPGS